MLSQSPGAGFGYAELSITEKQICSPVMSYSYTDQCFIYLMTPSDAAFMLQNKGQRLREKSVFSQIVCEKMYFFSDLAFCPPTSFSVP